jgi:hypothetical protein
VDTVIAGVSAAIALLALVVAFAVGRRQTDIQHRLATIEEARRAEEVEANARARVTATIVRVDARPAISTVVYPPPDRWLMLHNKGLARACSVELEQGPHAPPISGIEVLPVEPTARPADDIPNPGDA